MPRTAENIVERKLLLNKMDAASLGQILFLCAPGGYGKSVLARQWVARFAKNGVVWLAKEDNDPALLYQKLATALESLAAQPPKSLSTPANKPAVQIYSLLNTLEKTPPRTGAVLIDDLHLLQKADALDVLAGFCNRLPTGIPLVLCSRAPLPAPLASLQLRGAVHTLTAENLAFSSTEIQQLARHRGTILTDAECHDLTKTTGGWPLAAGALIPAEEQPEQPRTHMVYSYIKSTVWPQYNRGQQQFMLETCALPSGSQPEYLALCSTAKSSHILQQLAATSSFFTSGKNSTYRYQPLFRSFLLQLAGKQPGFLQSQYNRLGEYYMAQKDIYHAAEAFHNAGNHSAVGQALAAAVIEMDRNLFYMDSLTKLVDLSIGSSLARQMPFLYFIKAWNAICQSQPEDAEKAMDNFYSNIERLAKETPQLIYLLGRMYLMDYRRTITESLPFIKALKISSKHPGQNGSFTMDMPLLHRSYRDYSELVHGGAENNINAMRSTLHPLLGGQTNTLADMLAAGLLYEQGNFVTALDYALAAIARFTPDTIYANRFSGMCLLYYILDAMGRQHQAKETLNSIEKLVKTSGAKFLTPSFLAVKQRALLYRQDKKLAIQLAAEAPVASTEAPTFFRIWSHFTTVRAALAAGEFEKALLILHRILPVATRFCRPLDVIECHVLLAMSYWYGGLGQEKALNHLTTSLTMAQPFGFTTIFLSDITDLSPLLLRLEKRAEQNKHPLPNDTLRFLRRVRSLAQMGLRQNKRLIPTVNPSNLRLTEKQRQVLDILEEGRSFAEAAGIMGIKHSSVRSHIDLIYKKFGVTTEADALRIYRNIKAGRQ